MNTEGPLTCGKRDLLGYVCVDRMPGHAAVMRVQLIRALACWSMVCELLGMALSACDARVCRAVQAPEA